MSSNGWGGPASKGSTSCLIHGRVSLRAWPGGYIVLSYMNARPWRRANQHRHDLYLSKEATQQFPGGRGPAAQQKSGESVVRRQEGALSAAKLALPELEFSYLD